MAAEAVEQLRQGEAYKEEGNRWFKEANYKRALGAYHKVFCYVNGLQVPSDREISSGDTGSQRGRLPKERAEDLRALKQSTKLNMAACYLKVGEHQKCVDACTAALELGASSKAHFRRGQAYAELRNFVAAKTDLEKAQELEPDESAIAQELRKLKNSQLRGDEQERKRYAKMLGGGTDGEAALAGTEREAVPTDQDPAPTGEASDSHSQAEAASSTCVSTSPSAVAEPPLSMAPASAPATVSGTLVQPSVPECLDEASRPQCAVRELTYAWVQSDDDVKIYVPFDQSEELSGGVDESRVKVEFGEWSALLVINGTAEGKPPLGLRLGDFHRRIAPERCTCTVRGSRITLKLVKQVTERWWNLLQRAPL
eukprot:CAMPEP_0172682442 /NCGR_PEP_ID=MMETSP1074-20121228/18173_1 /TAXON_ID=2916 /ORGANISM="Ceratium fusus, Strain PA161109" /LENGTH=368 /DNA_ID=CAMNT_0013501127 /DNA_START=12 /DNA_END=1114 /DNA_ORIENTATION=-